MGVQSRVVSGLVGLAIAVMLAAAPHVAADTTGPQVPFGAVVGRATLVVVARAHLGEDGSVTVVIERVLQGTGPVSGRLLFADARDAPDLLDDGVVIIAFTDPSTLDAAAPTIAWQVSEDDYVDPDGLAPADGLPPTLAAMYTYFGQPLAAPRTSTGVGASLSDALVPILFVLLALAAAEGGIVRRGRTRR